ncbi:methionyl-tRNA formyltransferase [Candidatus Erwinia haradaeae]|uniref:Methionyl-tRNA formyltransferase n=1 Tax=Candidatus Erwinia haradaeae TaxID=1922217 RepID=A0A451D1Q7_9GAMM|nr:methionyl-tRNA formyltransferase [Candidatus Erwinia haradaeae]VFP79546.1 Methionyl-tRNA formyltransferase [Candidatus Erwinia haradaeae]
MSKVFKIIFAGTSNFGKFHLNALLSSGHQVISVLTRPDKPAGRGQKCTPSPVKKFAIEHKIPILQQEELGFKEIQNSLFSLRPDIIVVVSYGLLLPEKILTIPPLGCINVHASLLPRWRGAAPIQRAILAGDIETGVTIIQMNSGLDTGCILHTLTCPIVPTETSKTLYDKLSNLGSLGLLTTLKKIEKNKCIKKIQDEKNFIYANKLSKAEARLNWFLSAIQLNRCVRAFNPWPISYFILDSKYIKVWKASSLPSFGEQIPGEIIKTNKDGIQVATSDGILNIEELQPAGKKVMTAKDFLNSRRSLLKIGHILA